MERHPITCRDTTWLVSDARDRKLTDEEKQDLEEHVAACPDCRGASAQFKVLFRQIDALFGQDVGEGLD